MNRTTAINRRSALPAGLAIAILAAVGCGRAPAPAEPPTASRSGGGEVDLFVPYSAEAFPPSELEMRGTGDVDGRHLADFELCGGCHADAFAQQQVSSHAFSSFDNPIYRFAIDELRDDVGKEASLMCAGCHDISLLVDGQMLREVAPDDKRAHAGVTCRVCHGIDEARLDGNGSYVLSRRPIPLPKKGDPATLEEHKRAARPIESEPLCASCHRSFLSPQTGNNHFLTGQDDFGSWQTSAFNHSGVGRVDDKVEKQDCVDCHMPSEPAVHGDAAADEDGAISSHRFLGGHTWLASMLDDEEQLQRQAEFLKDSVTIDIAAAFSGDGAWGRPAERVEVKPGERLGLDVVVRNTGVGHRFPAGVRDAVDSWIEVDVFTTGGELLARSGDEDAPHRFRALVGDREGRPQLVRNTHDFYQPIIDHTIAPRDARTIRYEVRLPDDLGEEDLPLRARARLAHRTRSLPLQEAVCESFDSERAQAFAAKQRALGRTVLDPCAEQPVTIISEAEVWMGPGGDERTGSDRPTWSRLYEHALGLLPRATEHADEARDSLRAALESLGEGGEPRERAQILFGLASVYAFAECGPTAPDGWPNCKGRVAEVERYASEVEDLVPGSAATQMLLARSYTSRARFDDALAALARAAESVPENPRVWRALASNLVSQARYGEALEAARRGLETLPRDSVLLRVQALAAKGLGAPEPDIRTAWEVYERHDFVINPLAVRARCARFHEECARELREVHTHSLKLVTDAPKTAPESASLMPSHARD